MMQASRCRITSGTRNSSANRASCASSGVVVAGMIFIYGFFTSVSIEFDKKITPIPYEASA